MCLVALPFSKTGLRKFSRFIVRFSRMGEIWALAAPYSHVQGEPWGEVFPNSGRWRSFGARSISDDLRTANQAMPLRTKVNQGLQSIPEWMPEGHGDGAATEVEEAELV